MDELAGGLASLKTWSAVARAAVGLFLAVLLLLIAAYGALLYFELVRGWGYSYNIYNPVLASALIVTQMLLALFFLVAAVPVAGWIYRAHANLREAGVSALTYSPGWSVGSFFVPLVNLVIPFRAMRELHNRSHGESEWQAHSPVADVTSWWSCHIAAAVVAAVTALVALLATIPNLYVVQPPGVNTGLVLFSMVLLAGSAAFLFRTIGAVTQAQRQRLHLNHTAVFA